METTHINFPSSDKAFKFLDQLNQAPQQELAPELEPVPPAGDWLSAVRTERNRLLAISDWTMLGDVQLSEEKRKSWTTYRQQLRDITNGISSATDVTWPASPSIS